MVLFQAGRLSPRDSRCQCVVFPVARQRSAKTSGLTRVWPMNQGEGVEGVSGASNVSPKGGGVISTFQRKNNIV